MRRIESSRKSTASSASYAGPGRFRIDRIHLSEALVGISGLLMLAGFPLASTEQDGLLDLISVPGILVCAVGMAALTVPAVVALSSRTDTPIVWETLLSGAASLLSLALILVLAVSSGGGIREGYLVVTLGAIVCSVAGWRSVAREY